MCIIIYKKAGVAVNPEWFDNCAANNPHGFGLCFINSKGKLEVEKTLDFEAFKLIYKECLTDNPDTDFLLHFRKNTAGKTTEDNCHPFWVNKKQVMMHNGTIAPCVPTKASEDERSDTNIFAEEYLAMLPYGWENNRAIRKLVTAFVGDSKLVTMNNKGVVNIINETKGVWDKGLWLSNYSYYPNTKSLQKFKPYRWNSNVQTSPNTQKVIAVRLAAGVYYRFIYGERHVWDNTRGGWLRCNKFGEVTDHTQCKRWDDPTKGTENGKFKFYTEETKHKDLTKKERKAVKKAERLADGEEATKNLPKIYNMRADCDWCGRDTARTELEVAAFRDKTGIDLTLMCKTCIKDFDVDTNTMYDILPEYSKDELIEQQIIRRRINTENI